MTLVPGIAASRRRGAVLAAANPAARYWRLYHPLAANDSYVGYVEVELRGDTGGPDLSGSGIASASQAGSGNPASYAFDNSSSTKWETSAGKGNGSWLQYDFGGAVSVNEVVLTSTSITSAPRHLVLQHSEDGLSWTTAQIWVSLGIGANETHIFNALNAWQPSAGVGIAWRVHVTANNGNTSYTRIQEAELRLAAGGADQTPGGSALYMSGPAWDNDPGTAFRSPFGTPVPFDFGYLFRDPKQIAEIAITGASAGNETQSPRDFDVQLSLDGLNWTTVWSVAGSIDWTGSETRVFTMP